MKQIHHQHPLFDSTETLIVSGKAEQFRPTVVRYLSRNPPKTGIAIFSTHVVFESYKVARIAKGKFDDLTIHGVRVVCNPQKLSAFQRNMKCACCGLEGNVFLAERQTQNSPHVHLNLYNVSNGKVTMFTVDHILPDSLAGRSHVDNFQTMCSVCNTGKQNLMSATETRLVRSDISRYAKSWVYPPHLYALLDLQDAVRTTKSHRSKRLSMLLRDALANLSERNTVRRSHILATELYRSIDEASGISRTIPYKIKRRLGLLSYKWSFTGRQFTKFISTSCTTVWNAVKSIKRGFVHLVTGNFSAR